MDSNYVGIDATIGSLHVSRYASVEDLLHSSHEIKAVEFDHHSPPADWGPFIGRYILISWIPNLIDRSPTDVSVVTFRCYEDLVNQFFRENARHRSSYRLLILPKERLEFCDPSEESLP